MHARMHRVQALIQPSNWIYDDIDEDDDIDEEIPFSLNLQVLMCWFCDDRLIQSTQNIDLFVFMF